MNQTAARRRGRPKVITPNIARKIFLLAGYGLSEKQIADVFGISEDAVYQAKKDVDFNGALRQAKDTADLAVANSLFKMATGYDYYEEELAKVGSREDFSYEKVEVRKHHHPNVIAAIFWLKNRRGEAWKDKQIEDGSLVNNPAAVVQIFQTIKCLNNDPVNEVFRREDADGN